MCEGQIWRALVHRSNAFLLSFTVFLSNNLVFNIVLRCMSTSHMGFWICFYLFTYIKKQQNHQIFTLVRIKIFQMFIYSYKWWDSFLMSSACNMRAAKAPRFLLGPRNSLHQWFSNFLDLREPLIDSRQPWKIPALSFNWFLTTKNNTVIPVLQDHNRSS